MQYSTENLKVVLEWIIEQLNKTNSNISDLTDKFAQIERNKQGVAKNADDIAHLKRMCEELNQKSQFDEKRVSDMNVNVENMHMNLSLNHRTVMGLVEDHKELID